MLLSAEWHAAWEHDGAEDGAATTGFGLVVDCACEIVPAAVIVRDVVLLRTLPHLDAGLLPRPHAETVK